MYYQVNFCFSNIAVYKTKYGSTQSYKENILIPVGQMFRT